VLVELIDIAKQYLGVYLFLAFKIEINRSLAELCLFSDTLDGDRTEAIIEKKSSRSLQDGVFPVILLSFASFCQSQDMSPSVQLKCLSLYELAGDPYRILNTPTVIYPQDNEVGNEANEFR
jgi:hypothetical protein